MEVSSPDEVAHLRTENGKTYDLGNGKYSLVAYTGAVHYKDNYANKSEPWKPIDLTWEDNRITKAPYELTLDGQTITIRDKKTGEVSTCELLSSTPLGLVWEIVPSRGGVSFRHTLPSDKVPFEAQFRVTGKIPFTTSAFDDDGELELETSFVDGVLTEWLSQVKDKRTGKVRSVKGKIRVDPTWDITASTDDCNIYYTGAAWVWRTLDYVAQTVGYWSATNYKSGGGMRFLNLAIPNGSTINTAFFTLECRAARTADDVNTYITGEAVDSAATYSTWANYQARRGTVVGGANDDNITAAQVAWDTIANWTAGVAYDSPEIKTIIQEIINRGGWVSGNDLDI